LTKCCVLADLELARPHGAQGDEKGQGTCRHARFSVTRCKRVKPATRASESRPRGNHHGPLDTRWRNGTNNPQGCSSIFAGRINIPIMTVNIHLRACRITRQITDNQPSPTPPSPCRCRVSPGWKKDNRVAARRGENRDIHIVFLQTLPRRFFGCGQNWRRASFGKVFSPGRGFTRASTPTHAIQFYLFRTVIQEARRTRSARPLGPNIRPLGGIFSGAFHLARSESAGATTAAHFWKMGLDRLQPVAKTRRSMFQGVRDVVAHNLIHLRASEMARRARMLIVSN